MKLISLFLFLASLSFGLTYPSQSPTKSPNPNFSGIWLARVVRSPETEAPVTLKISYSEPKLKITRTLIHGVDLNPRLVFMGSSRTSQDFTYYTDGRGEVQNIDGPSPEDEPRSVTKRVEDRFVTVVPYTMIDQGKKIPLEFTLTLEVSSDGKKLTSTGTWTGASARRRVEIFDRVGSGKAKDINGKWLKRVSNRIIGLQVEHRDPEIKVIRRTVSESEDEIETYHYYTDGRGEKNFIDGVELQSVTTWEGNSLSFSVSSTRKSLRDTFKFNNSTKWELARDGQSLNEYSESFVRADKGSITEQPRNQRLVYARNGTAPSK